MRIKKYGHGSTRPPGEQNALLVHFHQAFIYRKRPSRIGRPVGPSLELSVTQIATRRSGVHSRRVQTRGMCGTSLFLLGWPLVVTRHWRESACFYMHTGTTLEDLWCYGSFISWKGSYTPLTGADGHLFCAVAGCNGPFCAGLWLIENLRFLMGKIHMRLFEPMAPFGMSKAAQSTGLPPPR